MPTTEASNECLKQKDTQSISIRAQGIDVDGTIQRLFEGRLRHHIDCINVDYKSINMESFYDLQLDIIGRRDVYTSFDKYVEIERLEGGNKYYAGQLGLHVSSFDVH
ncbi:ubiquitin carboxyl-terminal hydrolase 12-like protein isoform X2 [Tanacetum coccineum]